MSSRHLARIVVMQSLYEWDFRDGDLDDISKRNIKEFAAELEDDLFIKNLISGVIKNLKKIDDYIAKNAPEWPLEQIARIDKSVLRLAVYELLFSEDVPPKVAIDEAVELAKAFGGKNSSKFVNGVLGAIYRNNGKFKGESNSATSDVASVDKKKKKEKG